jgi:hypothetical protein
MRKTILDRLQDKTVEVGDCLEWTGYVNGKTPATSVGGTGIAVRSLIALRLGWDTQGKIVTNCCGNNLCVNPDHLKMMTKSKFHSHIAKTKVDAQALSRRMKISRAVRQRSKLTLEQANAIRNHPGPERVIVEEFGVNKTTVSRIRNGHTWKEYGMFGQLWTTP